MYTIKSCLYKLSNPEMSNVTTNTALRKPDDPLPEGALLRMYSMRMCPFAQRARLLLSAKSVPYDLVNIDLNNKPDWFFDANPYGEVPVIVHNGSFVFESLICCEYIEEAFPEPTLYSKTPKDRAWERIYFNHWTKKGIPAFYSLLKAGNDENQQKRFIEQVGKMEEFLANRKSVYFHGETVGMSDYLIWPWFERLSMLETISNFHVDMSKYPCLNGWITAMWKVPAVKECKTDPEIFITFYDKYRTGKPDFTIGAPVEEVLENLDGLRDPKTRFRQQKAE